MRSIYLVLWTVLYTHSYEAIIDSMSHWLSDWLNDVMSDWLINNNCTTKWRLGYWIMQGPSLLATTHSPYME